MDKSTIIEEITQIEYAMFDAVQGLDGRAACQDDRATFYLMRRCHYDIFSSLLLYGVLEEFQEAQRQGRNLIAEKYGYMMAESDPAYYATHLQDRLPAISPVKAAALADLQRIFESFYQSLVQEVPSVARFGRVQETSRYEVSAATYLVGELKTWSLKSLYQALEEMRAAAQEGRNPVADIVTCQSFGGQKNNR